MKSVYSAVRTGSLNKAVCASSFRTNSDLCHLQHKLIGFYNRCRECLLRGTVWVFKSDTVSSLKGVFEKCTFHLLMLHNVLTMSSAIQKSGLYILTGARFRKRTYEFDLQLLAKVDLNSIALLAVPGTVSSSDRHNTVQCFMRVLHKLLSYNGCYQNWKFGDFLEN